MTIAATRKYPSLDAQRLLSELREGRLAPVPGLELNSAAPPDTWHLAWTQRRHGAARG
ncbi:MULTISPECIES: hypothetical protein [unclassified Streptomyces]|uniref:hypothetical protein n=1 Tax=unclassified Streptomyces TaxID=2593676 RepID=UPI000369C889|nr:MULTISPECIES: hypothetical protein [unclassified Streptomyces]